MSKHDGTNAQHTPKTMMLFPVVKYRLLLCQRKPHRIGSGSLPAIVDSLPSRVKNHAPPFFAGSQTPIYIVSIHEEIFIEETDLIESLVANHGKAADNNIDVERPIVAEIQHVFAGEELRVLELRREAKG